MRGRRTFLKTILGFFLVASTGSLARALPAAAAGTAPANILVRRHGAHFLVDGWVLTARDLRAMKIEVPGQNDL